MEEVGGSDRLFKAISAIRRWQKLKKKIAAGEESMEMAAAVLAGRPQRAAGRRRPTDTSGAD